MYEKHFGLTRRPFPTTADTPCYYPSTAQERAHKQLTEAIDSQEGFAVLAGEPGIGKTLLAHRLLSRFASQLVTVWLANTHLPDCSALFQTLLYDLNLPYEGKREQELRLQLTDHLLEVFKSGKQTLLLIDEAHHLTPLLLEELRLLSNLETRDGKTLQVVLVGQPALLDTLRLPELASLAQRIAVQAKITGMEVHEAADYLVHQFRAVGGRPERLITGEALDALARGTRGVPRLLNQATHLALQIAFHGGQPSVDAEAAFEALNDLGLGEEATEEKDDRSDEKALAPVQDPDPNAEVLTLEMSIHDARSSAPTRPRRLFASPKRPA